jgi:hypothetical protein
MSECIVENNMYTFRDEGSAIATSLVSVVRHSPLDRDVGGSIPDMGKTQRISKTANFDKFFVSNPFA